MAMNGDVMGLACLAAVNAVTPPDIQPGEPQDQIATKMADFRERMMKAMCGAIVQHIQTFAQVTGPVVVTSVTGVTAGPAASGPGAGNLTAGVIA